MNIHSLIKKQWLLNCFIPLPFSQSQYHCLPPNSQAVVLYKHLQTNPQLTNKQLQIAPLAQFRPKLFSV